MQCVLHGNNCHLGNGSLRAGEMYKRLTFKLKPEPFVTAVETVTLLQNYPALMDMFAP